MYFVLLILTSFVCLDAWVWIRLDRALRAVRHGAFWRCLLGLALGCAIVFALLSFFRGRAIGRSHDVIPAWIPASIYIWHFLVLPLLAIALTGRRLILAVVRKLRRSRPQPAPAAQALPASSPLWSRRHFLTAGSMVAPAFLTAGLTARAMWEIGRFRIRKFELSVRDWPRELDGLTIAVIADVHTGVFSTAQMLDDIVLATNRMGADLVYLAGDLVNISHSDLPEALDMVNRLQARHAIAMVQGNHDVMQGRESFNWACRRAGVNLLVDQVQTLRVRGVDLQLLGARWPDGGELDAAVAELVARRDPGLPSILLEHHPHSFDAAAAAGVPLVLCGHTHGGQIMLTQNIGAGPIRFKYWSGLYEKLSSKLVISNGVGNWFPLRVNAPAELLHLTLHR